jgi:hypothetical protein
MRRVRRIARPAYNSRSRPKPLSAAQPTCAIRDLQAQVRGSELMLSGALHNGAVLPFKTTVSQLHARGADTRLDLVDPRRF